MISIKSGTVKITETTPKQIVKAVEEAKAEIGEFTDEPMPDWDMDVETGIRLRAERGKILVSSHYDGIDFEIDVNNNCESVGYSWNKGRDSK